MGENVCNFAYILIVCLVINKISMKLSGVYGHFEGELPWAECDEPLRPLMAKIVGK